MFVFMFHACFLIKVSVSFFHGFGGLFLYGNSSVWLPCGDHTPHKDCPVLWPQQLCLGGSRGLEVKICVQCALLPHKTYLHGLTRILKHPAIFSELVKEQRKNDKYHPFLFFIQKNKESLLLHLLKSQRYNHQPSIHSRKSHVLPVQFSFCFPSRWFMS